MNELKRDPDSCYRVSHHSSSGNGKAPRRAPEAHFTSQLEILLETVLMRKHRDVHLGSIHTTARDLMVKRKHQYSATQIKLSTFLSVFAEHPSYLKAIHF